MVLPGLLRLRGDVKVTATEAPSHDHEDSAAKL